MGKPKQLPKVTGPALPWLVANPTAVTAAVDSLNAYAEAVETADRLLANLTAPDPYSDIAAGSYTASEITALMAQVETLTDNQRALIALLKTLLAQINS